MTTAAAALRTFALAVLLVRAQALSNGVDGYYGTTGGGRYTKLDRFLNDRMGLGGNRSAPPALTTDRGLLTRTAATSAAVPEDEDDGGGDDDDDNDDEDEELLSTHHHHHHHQTVKLRHEANRWEEANDLPYDRVNTI